MKIIFAFFKLVRFPNLVFIIITQSFFYFIIFKSTFTENIFVPNILLFFMLVAASVFIAAAGYIINDYFDVQIDAINKPSKLVIDKIIKRRWAMIWHILFSIIGFVISGYIGFALNNIVIPVANLVCIILLWFYSTNFKRKLLSGNIIVSALTAWTIFVVYFFVGGTFKGFGEIPTDYDLLKFFRLTALYAGFSFIVSLIREGIKDLEDMEGDAKYDCHTMPIVWGVPAAKVFIGVWVIVCIGLLCILSVYVWQLSHVVLSVYTFVFTVLPFIYLLQKLYSATKPLHYHNASSLVKLIMLAGIFSMLFFIS